MPNPAIVPFVKRVCIYRIDAPRLLLVLGSSLSFIHLIMSTRSLIQVHVC